jgi:hypothetical protein
VVAYILTMLKCQEDLKAAKAVKYGDISKKKLGNL